MTTLLEPSFTAAEQLAVIKAEIAQSPDAAIVEILAAQLRDAIRRMPLLAAAMALVSAEIVAKDEAATGQARVRTVKAHLKHGGGKVVLSADMVDMGEEIEE